MGAEGVDWAAQSRFTAEKHVFQNLGDGTYYHSGYLAIRQAIAAKATITYKILYNDAVAMTGGQPVDGTTSVPQIARQVEAEGVKRLAVVSDEPEKYEGHEGQFPPGTTFHPRAELDAVQRELRELEGVTVLIYDQTCAAEKRRRRKKKEFPDPPRRIFINEAVCEGCGDCGQASNCLSVMPVETDLGRKRRIDQSSCNKDFSCVNGFCPSFVSVHGAELKKKQGASYTPEDLTRELGGIEAPRAWDWTGPFDMLVTGVGGTGVVTVGALVSMAAHLEGKQSSVLDFMGFAQKGGAVLSFVRLAETSDQLNQVRIDTQQADVLLACDMVVGASADALVTVKPGRTAIIANTHELPTAAFVRQPDASMHADSLLAKMRHAVASDALLSTLDAQDIALRLMGDTMPSNIVMLGACWQRGLVPLSEAALMRAMELNGVGVAANKTAFALGRLAAAAPAAIERLAGTAPAPLAQDLDSLMKRRIEQLTAYQDAAYAERYLKLVNRVREAEVKLGSTRLTEAVARYYAKLLAIKDEWEVARLYTDGRFLASMKEQFEGWERISFHMAPPLLAKPGKDGRVAKMEMGPWMMPALRAMARLRGLRGSWLDPFARTEERRMERGLITEYEALIETLLEGLTAEKLELAVRLASLPEKIRGYGHVKLANVASAQAQQRELLDRFHGATPLAREAVVKFITASSDGR
jgi:indolepyruvate ferredoxin oxidoreductase